MFQTMPVKISSTLPNSMPTELPGNSAIIASSTAGRNDSTGIDCRMSSIGTRMRPAARLRAAAYPTTSVNVSDSRYAAIIRSSERSA